MMENSFENEHAESSSMQIMVIEDDDNKYAEIVGALLISLDNPQISRGRTRNEGLDIIAKHYKAGNHYDLIVCDNYMPGLEGDDLRPFARNIITYIRHRISKDVQICVCSSEPLEECGYDFFVPYDPELSHEVLSEEFQRVIRSINGISK